MSEKIIYERESCSRCGGSGRYSYNAIDGDRCYGCSGKGTQLTRRGKSAADKIGAYIKTLCSVPAGDIKAGDRVVSYGGRYVPVLAVEPYGTESEKVSIKYRDVSFGGWEDISHIMAPTDMVRKAPSADQWIAIVAFARKYKGATIEVEAPKTTEVA